MSLKFSQPLTPEDEKHFDHACGYLQLGMAEDAWESLRKMRSGMDDELPVILLAGETLNSMGRYAEAILILAPAITRAPENPEFVILLAYATRRAQSIERALAILEQAAVIFPRHPLVRYNLACYCAQTGQEERALECLAHALKLDPQMVLMAAEDDDFEPLKNHPQFRNLLCPSEKKGK